MVPAGTTYYARVTILKVVNTLIIVRQQITPKSQSRIRSLKVKLIVKFWKKVSTIFLRYCVGGGIDFLHIFFTTNLRTPKKKKTIRISKNIYMTKSLFTLSEQISVYSAYNGTEIRPSAKKQSGLL